MKDWLRATARRFGYVIHRWPATRFDAIPDTLALLRQSGFTPTFVIDGGANVGTWTRLARELFPGATIHMVEPQAACLPALDALARSAPRLTVHPVALSAPSVSSVTMVGGDGATGAYVVAAATGGSTQVPAATLDALFADRVGADDRVLLKLDLEGHEVAALSGGERLLPRVDVILAECRMFPAYGDPQAKTFTELFRFLDARGFDLYDLAGLHGRARDHRLRIADTVFVRRGTALANDTNWD